MDHDFRGIPLKVESRCVEQREIVDNKQQLNTSQLIFFSR